ncbi:MAG: glycerol-3-phosphate acyltransferase [Oscillospiraceae bacterium]|nr:glycerol-3-phosphate acyltransferase [Oscillospiraceae bacterium]
MWLFLVVSIVAGYLLGNLNGAVCVSRLLHDDVRSHGSGNAGLTNFIRSYGASRSLMVIAIDAGKAVVACLLGGILLKDSLGFRAGAAIGGAAVMLGHVFPAFLGFRGGKGILSGLFIAIVVDWRIALLILGVFALAYFATQYVSLGSVLAAITFAVGFALLHHRDPIVMACGIFMGLLAAAMHWQNILRLVKGQERKTNLFKKDKE